DHLAGRALGSHPHLPNPLPPLAAGTGGRRTVRPYPLRSDRARSEPGRIACNDPGWFGVDDRRSGWGRRSAYARESPMRTTRVTTMRCGSKAQCPTFRAFLGIALGVTTAGVVEGQQTHPGGPAHA